MLIGTESVVIGPLCFESPCTANIRDMKYAAQELSIGHLRVSAKN